MSIPTLTAANAFHTARLTNVWLANTTDDDMKNAALYKARDYIMSVYRFLPGTLESDPLVQTAIIMMAPSLLDSDPATPGPQVTYSRKKLDGGGEIETHYSDLRGAFKFAEEALNDPYPLITAVLRPVCVPRKGPGAGSAKLVI